MDLPQLRFDDRLQPEPVGQRRRRLVGAAQRGDVDGGDVLPRLDEPFGRPLGLGHPDRVEGRIAVAVDQRERLARPGRLGFAVADQQQLTGTGRPLKAGLPVLLGLGVGHGGAP